MHFNLLNIVRTWFDGGYSQTYPQTSNTIVCDNDHDYIRGDETDRGPCPGLNALANQGYLARDGKNITLEQTQRAMMKALHMDWLAASSLSRTVKPLLRRDGTYDLTDLRRHNVVEHNGSFTRLDFWQGDNNTFQPDMYEAMLDDADGGPVTLRSLARTFKRRDRESRAIRAPPLPWNLWIVRLLQIVGLINVAQTGGVLSKEIMDAIFVEERFPDVILQNPKPSTLLTLWKNTVVMLSYLIWQ